MNDIDYEIFLWSSGYLVVKHLVKLFEMIEHRSIDSDWIKFKFGIELCLFFYKTGRIAPFSLLDVGVGGLISHLALHWLHFNDLSVAKDQWSCHSYCYITWLGNDRTKTKEEKRRKELRRIECIVKGGREHLHWRLTFWYSERFPYNR